MKRTPLKKLIKEAQWILKTVEERFGAGSAITQEAKIHLQNLLARQKKGE